MDDADVLPADGPALGVDQEYLLARELARLAYVRWRAAGGYHPVGGPPTQPELWAKLTAAQAAILVATERAGPADRAGLLLRVDADEPVAVEEAISWLETDPFVVHSGYYKQKLMRRVRRASLTADQVSRLQTLVLAVCRRGRREEFSETVRLALHLDDADLRERLRFMSSGGGSRTTAASAAARILAALESRGTHR